MSARAETRRLPAVFALAIATTAAMELAGARAYDAAAFGNLAFATAAGLLLGGLAVLWLRVPHGIQLDASALRWIGFLPAAAAVGSIHVRGILDRGPLLGLGIAAAAATCVIGAGAILRRPAVVLLGAIGAGVALRIFEFKVVPIAPVQGDMIPLVLLAVANTAGGASPYRMYELPWQVPLTYMPLNWIAYAPLFLAGVDPRWTNVLADLAVLGAIYFAARNRRDKTLRDAAIVLWAAWFVAHRLVKYDAGVAAETQWAALAWVAALAAERNRWTPAAVGAAIATTPLALPLVPTLAIAWNRAWNRPTSRRPHRPTWKPLVRAALITAIVAAVLILPWLLWSPNEFTDGVFRWFNDIDRFPRAKWNENRAWIVHPGLAGLFWTMHAEHLLKPIQAILLASLAVGYARKTRATGARETLGAELVGVFVVFLLFNPMVWAYLWEPAVCLGLVALAGSEG